jgi:hypothetical protein
MNGALIIRRIFYVFAIFFHAVLLFTNVGNYFHGGTPVELIAMQGIALVISMAAIKIFLQVKFPEKIAVALCAMIPLLFVIASLMSPLFDA